MYYLFFKYTYCIFSVEFGVPLISLEDLQLSGDEGLSLLLLLMLELLLVIVGELKGDTSLLDICEFLLKRFNILRGDDGLLLLLLFVGLTVALDISLALLGLKEVSREDVLSDSFAVSSD